MNIQNYIHNAEPLGWLDYIGMGVGVYGVFFAICLFIIFSPLIFTGLLIKWSTKIFKYIQKKWRRND